MVFHEFDDTKCEKTYDKEACYDLNNSQIPNPITYGNNQFRKANCCSIRKMSGF